VFYYFVLDALKNRKAMNDDGKITFGLLAEYVQRRVSRTIPELIGDGAKQSPSLVLNIAGESPTLVTPERSANKIALDSPAPPAENKSAGPADGNVVVKSGSSQLVGNWASPGETIHFHKDGSVVWMFGKLYLKGFYSLDQDVLDISFTEIKWDLRGKVTWMNGQTPSFVCQVSDANIPGVNAIGKSFSYQRSNIPEPPAPPTRQQLVGTWTNGGVTYSMNADHTFVMWVNGAQTSGTYLYGGNVLLVNYTQLNRYALGIMAWADPQTKTTVRSTMVSTNLPGSNPPGTYVDFRRVR
jgi:hypothetical protein